MINLGVRVEMFTTGWVLDLLAHIIPLKHYSIFFDYFFP